MERVQTNTHRAREYIEYHMHKRISLSRLLGLNSLQQFSLHSIAFNRLQQQFEPIFISSDARNWTIRYSQLFRSLQRKHAPNYCNEITSFERILLLFAIYVYPFVATDRAHFIENIIWGFLSLSFLLQWSVGFLWKMRYKNIRPGSFYLWCQFNVIHISVFYQMEAIV